MIIIIFPPIVYINTQLVPDLASRLAFQAGTGALLILSALPDLPLPQPRSEEPPCLPEPCFWVVGRRGSSQGLGSRCAQAQRGIALLGSLREQI